MTTATVTKPHDSRSARRGSAIDIQNVAKVYPGNPRPAVDNISLSISPGEFVVLLGPSGCGKTTLLKMVNRIYEPTSGTISIDGRSILQQDPNLLRRDIGYVIQQTGLFPHMQVQENIAVVPRLLKWDRGRISDRIDELLTLVGLDPESYRSRYPGQLSGGEQQRVGLARALAVSPSTMLMDEPFGALDAITRTRLQTELKEIHRKISQTVLFVTHDIEEAVRLADRIVIMRAGQIVQDGTPLEIVTNPADGFVADLVGADDVLRRFSLILATDAMSSAPVDVTDGPAVDSDASLREVLGALMESESPQVRVTDASGVTIGAVTMESLQRTAASSRTD